MPQQMSYDPSTQTWKPSGSSDSGGVSSASTPPSSSGGSSSAPTPVPAAETQTQTNSAGLANKAQAVLEYNTLSGELVLRAYVGVLKLKVNTTIEIQGIGSYLSGLYYVSAVKYTLNASEGFSIAATVIKTGFGPSLKSSPPKQDSTVREEPIDKAEEATKSATPTKGASVKIVGENATYSNASEGVKVPNWVKQKTLTVAQVSKDGTRVLLQPINSWTYVKNIQIQ